MRPVARVDLGLKSRQLGRLFKLHSLPEGDLLVKAIGYGVASKWTWMNMINLPTPRYMLVFSMATAANGRGKSSILTNQLK